MRKITMEAAITEALMEERARDSGLVIFGDNSTTGAGMMNHTAFDQAYPDNVVNMPVTESMYSNVAVGMALAGLRPIAEFDFQDFMSLGFDGMVNEAAKVRFWSRGKVNLPIVFMSAGGVLAGLGCNHTQQVESWFSNVPGLKICIPSTAADTKGLLKTAIRDNDPVVFLFNRCLAYVADVVPEDEYTVPMGKARIHRQGTDVSIVCWHSAFVYTMELVDALEKAGISCEDALKVEPMRICSPRTAVPSGESEFRAMLKRSDIAAGVFKIMGREMTDDPIFTAPNGPADFFAFTGSEVYDAKNPSGNSKDGDGKDSPDGFLSGPSVFA